MSTGSYKFEQKSENECWYIIRNIVTKGDYSAFWFNHILDTFPEAEDKALDYALSNSKPFISKEDSYNLGPDANPIVPDWFDMR
jgi:hypothetical protein